MAARPPAALPDLDEELKAVALRWLYAYSTGDHETVTNLFSADPALSYVGSSDNEVWRGDMLRKGMAGYMAHIPRFRYELVDCHAAARDRHGWVELHIDTSVDETSKNVLFRCTMLFQLEKGVWRLLHIHNSNPVSNFQALGFDTSGFDDFLAALRAEPADLAQTGIASLMFTDIVDSTTLTETLGDAEWGRIVKAHLAGVSATVQAAGGTLVKTLGDGTMSSFSSARAAMAAARDIQRLMDSQTREPRLRVRIGIHTGEVMASEGDFLGGVVNKAARVAAMCAPEEIRVSDATRAMVGGQDFVFSDPLAVSLKGLEGSHLIHRLEWRP